MVEKEVVDLDPDSNQIKLAMPQNAAWVVLLECTEVGIELITSTVDNF